MRKLTIILGLFLSLGLLGVTPAGASVTSTDGADFGPGESKAKRALRQCRQFYPKPTFVDVAPHSPNYCAIEWAASRGFVQGFGHDTFGPNNHLSKKAIITMRNRVRRRYGEGSRTFWGPWLRRDATREYVAIKLAGSTQRAVRLGIVRGTRSGQFWWDRPVIRQHAATMLARWVRAEYIGWRDLPVPSAY